jgi:hypothetical protein
MDHSMAVGIVEGFGHFPSDPHRVGHRELPLTGEPLAQRLALHIGHHVVQDAVGGPRIE